MPALSPGGCCHIGAGDRCHAAEEEEGEGEKWKGAGRGLPGNSQQPSLWQGVRGDQPWPVGTCQEPWTQESCFR